MHSHPQINHVGFPTLFSISHFHTAAGKVFHLAHGDDLPTASVMSGGPNPPHKVSDICLQHLAPYDQSCDGMHCTLITHSGQSSHHMRIQ